MDHIKEIKEIVAEQAYEQLKHNLEHVDTKELGEVIDMIKDTAEAAYYCSVVEAMEKAEEESKNGNGNVVYFTERYIPTYRDISRRERPVSYDKDGRYYNDGKGNYYDDGDRYNMPYYDYKEPVARDMREGRSPISRRRYMESKEHHEMKEVQIQELEKYMAELSQDMTEMIADSTPEEKQMLHKKLVALTDKIAVLAK